MCEWIFELMEVVFIYGCISFALVYFGIISYWYRLGGVTLSFVFVSLSDMFSMGENGDFGVFMCLSIEVVIVFFGMFICVLIVFWNFSFLFIMSRNRVAFFFVAVVLCDCGLVVNEVGVLLLLFFDLMYMVFYCGVLLVLFEVWKNWVRVLFITTFRLKSKFVVASEVIFEVVVLLIVRCMVDEFSFM